MKTTSRAPPPFDISRSAVFGIGIGVPVAACLAVGGPALALFAGVGAINALFTDPRRGVAVRLISIGVAIGAMLMVALLGTTMRQSPNLALAVAVAFAFPAGLVPPVFPYVSMVAKLLPLTIIVVATGVFPTGHVVLGFMVGTVFATLATIVEATLQRMVPNADPMHELVALWRGKRNDLAYAFAFTGAVALALVAAGALEATHPLWAAVAALFVMHPDPDRSMRCIAQRIAGTFAGVAIAWALVHSIDSPWALVALATGAAALMPWAMVRGLFFMTTIATVSIASVRCRDDLRGWGQAAHLRAPVGHADRHCRRRDCDLSAESLAPLAPAQTRHARNARSARAGPLGNARTGRTPVTSEPKLKRSSPET